MGRAGIALTAGLLLLGGCAQPEPSSLQPSARPSLGETPRESTETTVVPATPPAPTPPVNGSAAVVIAVGDVRIAYPVAGCPVTAWLDEAIQDGVSFGIYPEYLTLDDGSRWSTHMVVIRIDGAKVSDWSFRLTSPMSGIVGDSERSLISATDPDTPIDVAIATDEATFTTRFWDTESTEADPQPIPGTVAVTCR